MLMDLETLDWDDELLGVLRHPPGDAAADPAVGRPGLLRQLPRRGPAAAARCRSPAILGDQQAATFGQAVLRRRARRRTPTAPATSCCSTPARSGAVRARADHHGRPTSSATSRPSTRWRARSPSPARACSGCATSSASSAAPRRVEALAASGPRQRRRLLRAGLLRPVRPVLAARRPRRDRRPHPLPHQRAPRPGCPGGHLLPDARRRRGDGAGQRRAPWRCSRSTAG